MNADKRVSLEETKNGWIVTMHGFIKVGDRYVFKSTEILPMLEFLGEHVYGEKVRVAHSAIQI